MIRNVVYNCSDTSSCKCILAVQTAQALINIYSMHIKPLASKHTSALGEASVSRSPETLSAAPLQRSSSWPVQRGSGIWYPPCQHVSHSVQHVCPSPPETSPGDTAVLFVENIISLCAHVFFQNDNSIWVQDFLTPAKEFHQLCVSQVAYTPLRPNQVIPHVFGRPPVL